MKQKARLKAIQKAANNKAGEGVQPITEVSIYGTDDNGETWLLAEYKAGVMVSIPDNGRWDVQKAGRP
jgi:hypothetical protein